MAQVFNHFLFAFSMTIPTYERLLHMFILPIAYPSQKWCGGAVMVVVVEQRGNAELWWLFFTPLIFTSNWQFEAGNLNHKLHSRDSHLLNQIAIIYIVLEITKNIFFSAQGKCALNQTSPLRYQSGKSSGWRMFMILVRIITFDITHRHSGQHLAECVLLKITLILKW